VPPSIRSDAGETPGRVLVTGGAGFIGSNLVRALVERGHPVTVIDNLASTWSLRLIEDVAERVEFVHCDVRLAEDLERVGSGPFERVYHLAASFANELSMDYPTIDTRSNIEGTLNVLALARRLFERPMLDDQLQLASGAPKRWNEAVEAALKALSRLDSGKIALSGLAVTIEGVAKDKGTATMVSYQLKRDLPELFSSSESIKWKEADVTGNVGESIVPLIKEIINSDTGAATGALPSADLKTQHGSD